MECRDEPETSAFFKLMRKIELRFGEGREPALVAFSAAAGDGRISPSAEEKNQQEESECLLIKGDGFWSS